MNLERKKVEGSDRVNNCLKSCTIVATEKRPNCVYKCLEDSPKIVLLHE